MGESQTSLMQTLKGENQVSILYTCHRDTGCTKFHFFDTWRTVCKVVRILEVSVM